MLWLCLRDFRNIFFDIFKVAKYKKYWTWLLSAKTFHESFDTNGLNKLTQIITIIKYLTYIDFSVLQV